MDPGTADRCVPVGVSDHSECHHSVQTSENRERGNQLQLHHGISYSDSLQPEHVQVQSLFSIAYKE